MSVIVKCGGGKPEEEKTVTAGTSTKVVTPSEGKAIKKVTVNPTPTEEKTIIPTTSQQIISPSDGKHIASVIVASIADGGGVVPKYNRDAEIITPGTSDQVIPVGTYLRGTLTILGDSDLVPEKLPEDVNLFGVQGAREINSGIYAWTKNTYIPEEPLTNPSFTAIASGDSKIITIYSKSFDYAKIGNYVDFFDGFAYGNNNYFRFAKENGVLYFYSGTDKYKVSSFSTSSNKFTLDGYLSTYTNFDGTFTPSGSKSYPACKNELIGYVVSNDVSDYPENGILNGYWYELLAQVSSANVMSLSDDALATVQSDYRDTIVQEVSES